MFPERTWVMVDGIYRYNFMEKIYTGIYNNRFEHLLPVQTVPVLGQVKKLSLSRGKRLYNPECAPERRSASTGKAWKSRYMYINDVKSKNIYWYSKGPF